jgi:hypothetical protein
LPDQRQTHADTLVADDIMRKSDPNAEELILLVRAWKAAFAKAQSLGWLY